MNGSDMLVGPGFTAPSLLAVTYQDRTRQINPQLCLRLLLSAKLPRIYIFVSASPCASVAGGNEGVPNPVPAGLSTTKHFPPRAELACPPMPTFCRVWRGKVTAKSKAFIAWSAWEHHFRFLIPCLVSSTASTYYAKFLFHRAKCSAHFLPPHPIRPSLPSRRSRR